MLRHSRWHPWFNLRAVSIAACLAVLAIGYGWTQSDLAVHAAAPAAGDEFETKVKPILRDNCYKCHSHQAAKPKGGLMVDSIDALLAGGESGPAIVPGDVEKSLLVDAIKHLGGSEMPPMAPKLADADIATIEHWITGPAKDYVASKKRGTSNLSNGPSKRIGKITAEDKQWWAFRPIANPALPAVQNQAWCKNEVDRFVLAKLEAEGLSPAPEAARGVLIRRLYFDLWGLPPAPDDTVAFVADPSSQAYEALVDRLLASPRYGERMARQWLDLVRYADSDGYRIDDYRPHAWRYRDYVIRALNDDKPYNRFVEEQLAGDELYPDDPDALVATGYLCHWIYEYNNRDAEGHWRTILNDLTDTTGDVFLGMGLQCARCHDHKFDPILQKDYFRLQAFFAALDPHEAQVVATPAQRAARAEKAAKWEQATADLRQQLEVIQVKYRQAALKEVIEKFPEEVQAMLVKSDADRNAYEQQITNLCLRQATYEYNRLDKRLKGDDKEQVFALRRQLGEHEKQQPEPLPMAMTATDVGPIAPPIFIPKKSKDPIEPGFLTVLEESPAKIEQPPNVKSSTGRRTTLAHWLTRADNPLTARVVANRAWQLHFGRGLAANASDFGKLGEQPTHPELLDLLAARFAANGWSMKKLHRQIVLSAAYRQSANHPAPELARQKDPENRWYWRGNTRRLEAEQIRDTILAVSGELKLDAGGPGVMPQEARRTVYCRIMRNNRDPLLDVFDAPYWFQSSSSRDSTTTPVQSLLLFNSPLLLKHSEAFLARLEKDVPSGGAARIGLAYELAFGRQPTSREMAAGLSFLAAQPKRIDIEKTSSAEAAFLADKLPHRDGQAAVVSPSGPQKKFEVPHHKLFDTADFTVESFVLPRSVTDTGEVRTIAAKWDGNIKHPGWLFGITGKKSRRKPQTLVMQIIGTKTDGKLGEAAIFSDQNVQLNKPYYLAAAVTLARDGHDGQVSFFMKDLSNDDEPLLTAIVPLDITGDFANELPFTIGGRSATGSSFDGLVDDVRLSDMALGVDRLLFTNERLQRHTIGYWQFEAKPDVFFDSSGNHLNIQPVVKKQGKTTEAGRAAWRDYCHVLLNSNEFLYVE